MTDPADVTARERCSAIIENLYYGVHAWYTVSTRLPRNTHRCDGDVDDFHVYDKGQTRLCTAHGEQRRIEDAQTRGDAEIDVIGRREFDRLIRGAAMDKDAE